MRKICVSHDLYRLYLAVVVFHYPFTMLPFFAGGRKFFNSYLFIFCALDWIGTAK